MHAAARYRLFIVGGRDGRIVAWASEIPLGSAEARSLVERELARSGAQEWVIGSGAHDERPGDWVTVSFEPSSGGRPALDSVGLAPDERTARLLARLVELRGGSALALRVRRIGGLVDRFDPERLRELLTRGSGGCPRCGLRRRAGRRHRRDCA